MFQIPDTTANPAAGVLREEERLVSSFKGLSLDEALNKIASSAIEFAFKLLIAILVFYAGRFIIKRLYKFVKRLMAVRQTDASLSTFVLSLLRITLYFILIVTVIGILGIETSSFLALFASAGVAIGMALSGTLQNFAGGVLILLLKPYRVGDYIETQGYTGTVKAIQIFNTVINTVDNKAIIIPNGGLSTGTINNYSLEQYRRVDWTVGLSYSTDYAAAREVILAMLASDPRVVKKYVEDDRMMRLEESQRADEEATDRQAEEVKVDKAERKEGIIGRWLHRGRSRRRQVVEAVQARLEVPAQKKDCSPFVGLGALADSSINLTVRAWTRSSDYWSLFYDMNERFYTELPKKGFSFPFPQMDVHVSQENS